MTDIYLQEEGTSAQIHWVKNYCFNTASDKKNRQQKFPDSCTIQNVVIKKCPCKVSEGNDLKCQAV